MTHTEFAWRPGTLGALVDELGRALRELEDMLESLDDAALRRRRALPGAQEELSMYEVVEHVIHSGHIYDDLLRGAFAQPARDWEPLPDDAAGIRQRLRAMPADTWELLADKADWPDDKIEGLLIRAGWGTDYDLEQLLEHAVVHVLRHRRQLERLFAADALPGSVAASDTTGQLEAYFQSAEWYDRIYGLKDYAGEAALLAGMVAERLPEACSLLDVACGTGRHLEHLSGRFDVEGLDLSAGQLEEARKHLPGTPLHLGDMRDFSLGRHYDVVCCLFSAIGYMTTLQDLARACACLARHARPGGLVLVEPWLTPEAWHAGTVHALLIDEPELKIARVNTSRTEGRLSLLDLHHLVGTPRGTEHVVERHELLLATREELRGALEAAGLEVDFDEHGLGGRGLWICRRPC